jgi:hypothetical protein
MSITIYQYPADKGFPSPSDFPPGWPDTPSRMLSRKSRIAEHLIDLTLAFICSNTAELDRHVVNCAREQYRHGQQKPTSTDGRFQSLD